MGSGKRKAKQREKVNARLDSPSGRRKIKYAEMAQKGVLGKNELLKYEKMRRRISNFFPERRSDFPPAYNDRRQVCATRTDYNNARTLLSQLNL